MVTATPVAVELIHQSVPMVLSRVVTDAFVTDIQPNGWALAI
jgi:hypothetical protein